jgi:NADPH:quinone reductase-like Zn-dependent oxidoreductase
MIFLMTDKGPSTDSQWYDLSRLAAAVIANSYGASVAAPTRNPARDQLLRTSRADQVFIDTESIAQEVKKAFPNGVDKVLELVGTTTLKGSLRCAKQGGIVCMTGIVGNKWSFNDFTPMRQSPLQCASLPMPASRGTSCKHLYRT